jgi:hypothetical protein
MWRILDLRNAKYVSVISIKLPIEWGLIDCLNTYFERWAVDCSYSYIRDTFPTNIPQSTMDKQSIIEEITSLELLQSIAESTWIDRYQQDAVRMYLTDCVSETILEYQTKRKALLGIHKCGTKVRHFYEAIDMEVGVESG